MVLIPCPECGTEVSTLASACPKCGAPIAGPIPVKPRMPLIREWIGWILIIFVTLDVLVTCSHPAGQDLIIGTIVVSVVLGVPGTLLVLSGRKKRGK
jgi:zinc-ribbon domain